MLYKGEIRANALLRLAKKPFALPGTWLYGRMAPILAAGLLLAVLAPFIYAFAFCFPMGDDYDEAARAMFLLDLPGGIYEICREWLTWSGRYSYHFLAVFLGKAAESRALDGLACGSVLILYGVAGYLFGRAASASRPRAVFFGLLSLCSLCACFQYLPVFYLLTDALTSGLQGGAFLLFLSLLCGLWSQLEKEAPTKNIWRCCAISGIFAIGLYEHSAMATLCAAFAACFLSILYPSWPKARESRPASLREWARKIKSPFCRPFFILFLVLLAALLFSFLAPGNLQRQAARGVDNALRLQRISLFCGEWANAICLFWQSLWPLYVLFPVFFARAIFPAPRKFSASFVFIRIAVIGAAFIVFSLGAAFIHALSDTPLSASPKLGASIGFYAALAFGLVCHNMFLFLPKAIAQKNYLKNIAFAGCVIVAFSSHNFQTMAINAASGKLLAYGNFMAERRACLRQAGKDAGTQSWRRFGLAGEISRGGKRRADPAPNWPFVIVPAIPFAVYPAIFEEPLKPRASEWPNHWAAWLYGVAGVEARMPDGKYAVGIVASGEALELAIPPTLEKAGIAGAWQVISPFQANPAFETRWLVVERRESMAGNADILLPAPISWQRLLPVPLQKYCLRKLLASSYGVGDVARLAAIRLKFNPEQWRYGDFYAFPVAIGYAGTNASGPHAIFISLNSAPYARLMPFLK